MDLSIGRAKGWKIAAIISLSSLSLAVLVFGRSISEFAPKHNVIFYEIVESGHLPDQRLVDFTPGYYSFGTILTQVTGSTEYQSLFAPLLAVPIAILLFATLYRLSENALLSSVLLAGYLVFGSDGTDRLFLGLHGTGWILLFTSIILLLGMVARNDGWPRYFLGLCLASVSVVFVSYNRSAELILLFGWILAAMVALTVLRTPDIAPEHTTRRTARLLFPVIAITVAVHVFLSRFLDIAVPWLVWATTESGYSGFGRLLSLRFNVATDAPLAELHAHTPLLQTMIGSARYLLMAALLLTFLGVFLGRVVADQATLGEVVIVAFICSQGSFAVVRAAVGNLNVTYAFLPTLFATALLFSLRETTVDRTRLYTSLRVFSIGVAVVLLASALLYTAVALNSQTIHDTKTSFETAEPAAAWHATHVDSKMRSDEYTANLVRIHEYDDPHFEPREDIKQANTAEILTMAGRDTVVADRYFIFNHDLEYLVFSGWNRLQPWDETVDNRRSDTAMHKLYDQGTIVTYKFSHDGARR